MSDGEYKLIDDQVGLWGAVALLIGTAVGMSIFIVPTQSAAQAGPAIILAILLSIPPMILGVLLLLQLGSAIPVAGGIYVYGSRLVGPYWGFVGIAIPVLAVWSYLLFVALGFAQYLPVLFEVAGLGVEIPTMLAAWLLLVGFLVLNYLGISLVTRAQIAMVLVLMAGMVTFIIGGLLAYSPENLFPLFPAGEIEVNGEMVPEPYSGGITPFLLAMVLLYIPFQGFSMIIEIGEELKDPVKNIPRVLGIGMTFVTILSVGIVLAVVVSAPWHTAIVDFDSSTGEFVPIEGGLAEYANLGGFLPGYAIVFLAISALLAGATTVNTLLTSYSRTVMRAARDDVVPRYFAAIHDRHNTPYRAIMLMSLPPIIAVPLHGVLNELVPIDFLDWLVVVVVSGIFIGFMIGGVALWKLPQIFPQRYEHSFYKLPMPVLRVVAVGNVVASVIFTLFVASSAPSALAVVLAAMLVTYFGYRYRVWKYNKKGIDIREQMALLDKHEEWGSDD